MKIYQEKNIVLRLAIILSLFFVFPQSATAQQLKPAEIVYSRLPTDLNHSPTGANSPTIWATGQDGANDRQLTAGMEPRISDDGRYLLFRRIVAAEGDIFHYNPYASQATGNLWVRDLANNSESMIFDFSSGNRRLIGYYFSPFSNQGNYQIVLDYGTLFYKMNLDGTDLTALDPYFGGGFPREGDFFPVLRRGDSRIAAASQRCDGCGIVTRTLGSELPVQVANTDNADYNPSWSNDNQFLGFASLGVNRNFVYGAIYYPYFFSKLSKIKTDGSGRTTLLDLNANEQSPNGFAFGTIWTDDNSKIITAARINNIAGLYAVKTDGSGYARIPISAGNAPDFVGGIVQAREEQQVVSSGGGVATNGNYSLVSTIGETVAGQNSSGGNYSFTSGFWASFALTKNSPFDFDGDGKTDIAIFRPSVGEWWINRSSTGATVAAQFGASTDKPVPGDFTGDGKTDIAFFRPSTGEWFVLRSENGSFLSFRFGTAGDIPFTGDFDADGKSDVGVFRPSTNEWFVSASSGGTIIVTFGATGDKPVVADYDGDGKADIAIFRPSDGSWWYLRSSDNQFRVYRFGVGTDKPVQGDYTGDGKTDIAVFRPSTGEWFVQRSEDNSFFSFTFGTNGDVPAPGDYDGDGKTDAAVFRPSGSTWFVYRSTAGILITNFGTGGDQPVPGVFVP